MKTQSSKTAAVMNLLARGQAPDPVPMRHEIGPASPERTIETVTDEILEAKRVGGEAILTIGKGLIEAKGMLSEGEWLPWLTDRVDFSPRTAQRFMRLAREWSDATALSHLGATKALALLALPEEERDTFMSEVHTVDGEEKGVIDMSARELEKAIRDREQALADKAAAEEARAKMEADMRLTKDALDRASEEAGHAADRVIALEKELDELRSRPVEVAVETIVDQAAIEAARAQAVAEMQKKLDAARDAQKKAEDAKKAAEEKRKSAEEALDETRRKLAGAVAEKQDAEKALAAAKAVPPQPSPVDTDAVVAQFQVYFDQAQGIVNQLRGLLLKARNREDGATAEKLQKALLALSAKIGEAAA